MVIDVQTPFLGKAVRLHVRRARSRYGIRQRPLEAQGCRRCRAVRLTIQRNTLPPLTNLPQPTNMIGCHGNSSVTLLRNDKWKSPPDNLEERVVQLSTGDTRNVRMSEPHLGIECWSEGSTWRSVLDVLRHGRFVGSPELDEYGDWRIEMRRKVAGRRVHVVVAVGAGHLECITTW